ncbi:potassium channel family protein [Adhaeretor mobilis]|nr:potassium channel protein [Adhaeretor mobilis]
MSTLQNKALSLGIDVAVLRCVLILLGIVTFGTWGFWVTETDWTLWRSLYFTLITITTVGYGDQGLSETGQKFAAIMLLGGIGGFTYSITNLVQLTVNRDQAQARKLLRKTMDWESHVIVCGYGRMGQSICEQLRSGGKDCVVIEDDQEYYELAMENGFPAVHGCASEDESLVAAGIKRANSVITAVTNDAENMYAVVSARDLNPECSIISRAESASAARKMERAGATFVVLPHMMAGESVASAVLHPRLTSAMQSSNNPDDRLTLGEAVVEEGSELLEKTVMEYGKQAGDLVFVAVEREDGQLFMRPRGDQTFEVGDVVICAGRQEDVQAIREVAGGAVAV